MGYFVCVFLSSVVAFWIADWKEWKRLISFALKIYFILRTISESSCTTSPALCDCDESLWVTVWCSALLLPSTAMVPSAVTNKEFPNRFGAIFPATKLSYRFRWAPVGGRTLRLISNRFVCKQCRWIEGRAGRGGKSCALGLFKDLTWFWIYILQTVFGFVYHLREEENLEEL